MTPAPTAYRSCRRLLRARARAATSQGLARTSLHFASSPRRYSRGIVRDPRPSYVFMSEEDAKRIVDHVVRFHEHPERWECLVHCMAGVSRSGAVGTFIQRVAGIPAEHFLTQNTGLHPNRYVLKLLMRELSNRGWAGLDGHDDPDCAP